MSKTSTARRVGLLVIGTMVLTFLAVLVVVLAAAVFATRTPDESARTGPMLDEHGYLIPGAGPCCERRGSLVVDRQLAGV